MLSNPYLEEFTSVNLKKPYLISLDEEVHVWTKRSQLVEKYSWAVPNKEAIELIESFAVKIVEIGAGTGYWAWLLQQREIEVRSFDKSPPPKTWTKVESGDQAIAGLFPSYAMMLCWPEYSDPMAANCLSHYDGRKLIYIGEDSYGCTGDKTFHDELETKWSLVNQHYLPQWHGIHDSLCLYERRSGDF